MRHPSANMMNELARSVLSLYSYDPDPDNTSIENLLLQSVKLIGCFPSIVANAYAVKRHYFQGDSLHIHFPVPELSTAENFLRMIRPDTSYTEEEAHLLDMMLMVHAEHGGGNNSTFVCRAMSSSGTDTYSAIAARSARSRPAARRREPGSHRNAEADPGRRQRPQIQGRHINRRCKAV